MKTLYVHIGTHKTGTTTIQRFCTSNRPVFKSKGYVYPVFSFRYPNVSWERNGSFLGAVYRDEKGMRHTEIESANFQQGLDTIHELFQTYESVILSDESIWVNLYRKNPQLLSQLVEDSRQHNYRIKIIIYLRRQDEYIETWWNQRVKNKIDMTKVFPDFVRGYKYLNYRNILFHFADIVGKENLSIRRFRECLRENGILEDFMEQIGLTLTDEYLIPADLNPSIYGYTTEIKRIINGIKGYNFYDNLLFIESFSFSSLTSKESYRCSEFSEEERAEFMQQFEEGNKEIADQLICDGNPLFSDDYSGPPKREPYSPDYLEDIIRANAATDIILHRRLMEAEAREEQLLDAMQALEKKVESQERRLRHLRHPIHHLLKKRK